MQHRAVKEGDKKQLGLFFFVESDAKALVEKVKAGSAVLALRLLLQLLLQPAEHNCCDTDT